MEPGIRLALHRNLILLIKVRPKYEIAFVRSSCTGAKFYHQLSNFGNKSGAFSGKSTRFFKRTALRMEAIFLHA